MHLCRARDIKENVCKMSDSTVSDGDPRFSSLPAVSYELPDGTQVDIGIERFLVSELLCDTAPVNVDLTSLALIGLNSNILPLSNTAIPRLVCESVYRCEPDNQFSMLSNMVITGGGSSFDGTSERMRQEIEKIVHQNAPGFKVKAIASGSNERGICAWLGGSILGSLGSFHELWIAKQEYLEYGASIVDRKCP